MEIAVWIIAICEVIRLGQNALQLNITRRHDKMLAHGADWEKALQKIVDGEKWEDECEGT